MIEGDPTQFEQMLLNLCINANHAMTMMRGQMIRPAVNL